MRCYFIVKILNILISMLTTSIVIELPNDIYQRLEKQAIYEGLTEHDWCKTTLTKQIRELINDYPLPDDIENERKIEHLEEQARRERFKQKWPRIGCKKTPNSCKTFR